MKLVGDFHTHTNYTHGLGSIEDSVKQAENLGLKAIAITDHAYNSAYHMKPGDLDKMRQDIDAIRDKYKTKILLGVEANLISRDGQVDVSDEELNKLDLVVLGYHRFTKVKAREFFGWVLPNLFKKKKSNKQIVENTQAYLNAMDKHRVNILAHLNYGGCQVDVETIAKECVKRNIYIELNGRRICFTPEEISKMIQTGVKFIIDSDAHHPLDVGKNHRAFNLIEKYNIPLEQVVNLNEVPEFK